MTRPMNSEKQRRYRARRDEDAQRRQQYLEKEREKWKKDIETGKKKTQKDRTAREQRAQRKKWREAHRRSKERKKALQTLNTSPDTPESLVSSQPQTSRQQEAWVRRTRAAKAKSTRKLLLMEEKLKKANRRIEKYRKRIQRLTKKQSISQNQG